MSAKIALAASVAALWPVWVWCAARMADRSDDPLGAVALLAAVALCAVAWGRIAKSPPVCPDFRDPLGAIALLAAVALCVVARERIAKSPTVCPDFRTLGARRRQLDLAAGVGLLACCLIYCLSASFLPMLIRAGFAVTAVALIASPIFFNNRLHLPTYGLLLLSLPVVATMQFYLGYPMRLLVTNAVHAVLACAGYAVSVAGTDLVWNGHVVGIDPACSGVRMLWTAFFVCFAMAGLNRLSNRWTAALAGATLGIALVGNIFRATLLFMIEVMKARTALAEPAWLHAGIGILLFGIITIAISAISKRWQNTLTAPSASSTRAPGMLITAALVVLFVGPHAVPTTTAAQAATVPTSFPTTFESRKLTELPLTPQEQQFAAQFPGKIAKFTDGTNTLIMRIVTIPTRQLHPSEDCFRGLGYTIHPLPNIHDGKSNTAWGAFTANTPDGMTLTCREQITDTNGNSFTDVSAWYWSALLGKSHGPWLATTVATRATDLN